MNDWWESGDYDGTCCKKCSRERVMKCDAPDGTIRRVCEKCVWDQDADCYASLIEFPQAGGQP